MPGSYVRKRKPEVVLYQRRADGKLDAVVLSSQSHLFLGVDPNGTSAQERAAMMRAEGWTGPKNVYLPVLPPTMQRLHRGFVRVVADAGEVL